MGLWAQRGSGTMGEGALGPVLACNYGKLGFGLSVGLLQWEMGLWTLCWPVLWEMGLWAQRGPGTMGDWAFGPVWVCNYGRWDFGLSLGLQIWEMGLWAQHGTF